MRAISPSATMSDAGLRCCLNRLGHAVLTRAAKAASSTAALLLLQDQGPQNHRARQAADLVVRMRSVLRFMCLPNFIGIPLP